MTWAQAARWGFYPDRVVWDGKPWALITSVFVHREIWHIAFNLYWLWILGNVLEDAIGPWRWLAFFLAAAVVSSGFQLLISGGMGIGMSGVGYALFGFGWIARHKIPTFQAILNEQTIGTFLIWMVGCMVATQFGWVQIANGAHVAGLAFGAVVAGLFVVRWKPLLSGAGLLATTTIGMLPLFWCPLSMDWTAKQANQAFLRHDYATAIGWYRRNIVQGGDKFWALSNIELAYIARGDLKQAANTMDEMKRDPTTADKLAEEEKEGAQP